MTQQELVKIIVPYIWSRFKIYLNDPNYFVRGEDKLASLFRKGEDSVKQFISDLNRKLSTLDNPKPKKVKYNKNLTYHDVLTKFVKL